MFRMLPIAMLVSVVMTSGLADACPFCSAVSQTFSEEMASMDVVAIAKLQKAAAVSRLNTDDPQAEVPKSRFAIVNVIKGQDFIKTGDAFDTIYFGEAKKDRPFLAMATDAPNLMWSTPLILSDRAEKYLLSLNNLTKGSERLAFFQDYLEDEDEMLARDAYDEFAKAPYKDVIELKSKMDHEKLLKFIRDKDVPSNRRRLYFTMLGVCGKPADAELLEQLMTSKDRKEKAGLDAMLACYLILTGEQGLDRVDELFLKRKDAEYADTYAAIMAIRFHGSETDVIPRTRLVESLRLMLDRPELADLVIPDLARWEDWEIMPRLVELFVDADENSSWVRVPVINYLRACPDPIAKENIEELKKVDADAVRRAMTFFPLGPEKKDDAQESKSPPKTIETSKAAPPATSDAVKPQPAGEAERSGAEISLGLPLEPLNTSQVSLPGDSEAVEVAEVAQKSPKHDRVREIPRVASSRISIDAPATMQQVEQLAEGRVNIWLLLGVTFFSGGLCFVAMRSILGVGR